MSSDQQFDSNFLDPIVGECLSGVAFVMDYVQFQFDSALLTALILPAVRVSAALWTSGEPGWRDTLCERIGVVVQSAYAKEGEQLAIDFVDGSRVTISLHPSDYRGPEAINFRAAGGPLVVF
jgi:hypothetical protein